MPGGQGNDDMTDVTQTSSAQLGPGGHWRNWVGNQSFIARHIAEPGSEDDLAALVREASRQGLSIRVAGSGHSFTPIVATSGLLLKIKEFIQSQDQIFQKLEAYSKTIILIGYAGLFAVWGFVKDHLSHRAIVTTAALVGFSLIVYIASEIVEMNLRGLLHHRFNQTIKANPADPAKAISDFVEQARTAQTRATGRWRVILPLTVVPGFAGALILLYNVLADLTGLPQWP